MMFAYGPVFGCFMKPRVSGIINGHNNRIYGSIPYAKTATGTAPGPGHVHDLRVGPPTGRITALPTKKLAEKTNFRR